MTQPHRPHGANPLTSNYRVRSLGKVLRPGSSRELRHPIVSFAPYAVKAKGS